MIVYIVGVWWCMVVYGGVCMVVYGGGMVVGVCMVVCMVVYGGVWWCVWWCAIDNPRSSGAREPPTAARRDVRFGVDPDVFVYGAWCGLYLKVVYEFRVDVFLLRHVLLFEYDVVLKDCRTF
jgi:hypothetical protein